MDHVVIAIYFVGFLGWFAWLITLADKGDKERKHAGLVPFPYGLLGTLILAVVSYALFLALFYGASWLVAQGLDDLFPKKRKMPWWY